MQTAAGAARQPEHPLILAERVNGTSVFSTTGEKIGKLEDVAIEKVSGHVAYAIIGFGSFLGLGERFHAIPWGMLTYDEGRGGYVIPCDRDQLEKAPTIDASQLSGWSDAGRRGEIFDYYGRFGYPL
jgi:sporulation protein YlmC with PRC-barrel domain